MKFINDIKLKVQTMIKQWAKSKTMLAAFATMALGVIEVNFHLLQGLLGEYYGVSFIAMSIIMGALRLATTTAISEK